MINDNFHTFNEYMKKQDSALTASMEDYLEMIYRLSEKTGFTRIHELSNALNVQPPSATKMVQRLGKMNLIKYEKYGIIILEELGKEMGAILIKRHNTIESLLRILGVSEKTILEETEKAEHTLSEETIHCIEEFLDFAKGNSDIILRFKAYRDLKKANSDYRAKTKSER